jgi:hypothetical protein
VERGLFRPRHEPSLRPDKQGGGRVERDRSFIAVCRPEGGRFSLLCLDSRTGKLLWEGEVWAFGTENLVVTTGWWSHDALLVPAEDTMIVFGWGGTGCYVEAFAARTGKAVFRFATNLWFQQQRS